MQCLVILWSLASPWSSNSCIDIDTVLDVEEEVEVEGWSEFLLAYAYERFIVR